MLFSGWKGPKGGTSKVFPVTAAMAAATEAWLLFVGADDVLINVFVVDTFCR